MRFESYISQATIVRGDELDQYGISDDCLYALVYPGGSHIVRSDGDDGSWCLTIGNESELSEDLLTLEAQLYLWAADEGHFDDTINTDTLFEWIIAHCAQARRSAIDTTEYVVSYENFRGYIKTEKHFSPRSALTLAYCKDTVQEYFNLINRSIYTIKGLS